MAEGEEPGKQPLPSIAIFAAFCRKRYHAEKVAGPRFHHRLLTQLKSQIPGRPQNDESIESNGAFPFRPDEKRIDVYGFNAVSESMGQAPQSQKGIDGGVDI
ncbi:MAG: hypothetical protein GEU92_09450, partial [Alphaproteobacteria bacterium]|nr:hypothetical protein [Alphaproteobacteria bacterium]